MTIMMHQTTIWFIFIWCCTGTFAQNVGRFWHVSDFHYDLTYWTEGSSCNANVSNPGKYGDYWCDSPWLLVQDTIRNMAQLNSDVDFVLWTGDSVGHIKGDLLDQDLRLEIVENITTTMNSSFPDVPVYPLLGNHEFHPTSQAPYQDLDVYERVADMWEDWIANQTQVEFFKGGGYYSTMVGPKIRLLALNTNLYYTSDKLTADIDDPAGQLQWMRSQLENAKARGEKVIIAGHVPPGPRTPLIRDWFYPKFQTKFVDLVTEFSDVIVATHFGHEHSDGFKILQKDSKSVTQFTAPSVTPWRYITQTANGLETADPHNPGIRLVEYDTDTGKMLNYHQYYINLTESNANGQTKWAKLYSFTDAYKVADMSVSSLKEIFSRMENGEGEQYSSLYCNHAKVSAEEQTCTDQFRAEIYCGGLNYKLDEAKDCIGDYLKTRNTAVTCGMSSLLIGAMAVLGYAVKP